jgi:hypothetical protein
VAAITARRRWAEGVGFVIGLVILYYALPFDGRLWFVGIACGAAVLVGIVPLGVRQTRIILASNHPVADTARAMMVLVTVVVLSFASCYYAIELHAPAQIAGLETKTDAVYFAVVILGTVGFGDIVPTGQFARVATTVNILFNIALVAATVRLVTWAAGQRVGSLRRQE